MSVQLSLLKQAGYQLNERILKMDGKYQVVVGANKRGSL